MTDLHSYINPKTGKLAPMVSDDIYKIMSDNADRLNSAIIYDRDYNYNYFGFKVCYFKNSSCVNQSFNMLGKCGLGNHAPTAMFKV